MSNRRIVVLAFGPTESTSATHPSVEGIPEWIAVPEGPFDPVLVQPVPQGRSLPPANHVVNDPIGGSGLVQSEIGIGIHNDEVIIGWNDAGGFSGEVSVSGSGYSADRGDSWIDYGAMPEGANVSVYGDPTPAAFNNGHWIFGSIDLGSPNGVAVNHGDFVGGVISWQPAVKAIDGNAFLDKEYFDHDRFTDTVYLTYKNFGNNTVRLRSSSDNGSTWSTPVTVATTGGNGAYPAAGVDGEVYVTWASVIFSGNVDLMVRHSPDGGQTWTSNPVVIDRTSPQSGARPQCFNRSANVIFPSCAVITTDGPYRGRAIVVWTDGSGGTYNCYTSYSDDSGQTWTDPVQLNDNENWETSEQFWPQIHAAPDGRLSVARYDRRNATNNNSLCDTYVTQSVDGGVTWGPNRRASDVSVAWCGVPADISPNFGDYNEVVSDERSVFCTWADARLGDPDVIFARFDDRHLLNVTGDVGEQGITPVNGDGVAWLIPNEAEIVVDPAPAYDSEAQLAIASLAMSMFASPQETDGIWTIGGNALSGSLTMTKQGTGETVEGGFTIAQNGPADINFDFDATSDPGLSDINFANIWSAQVVLQGDGPGQVAVSGTVTMSELFLPVVFSLSGTISMDGAPGTVFSNPHGLEMNAKLTVDTAMTLHTRTLVTDDVVVAIEPLELGTNLYPFATVGVSPNPYAVGSRVRYTLSHPGAGEINIYSSTGRLVRNIADQTFTAGTHSFPFDGKDNAGRDLPSGGYFVRLKTDLVHVSGKVFIVR